MNRSGFGHDKSRAILPYKELPSPPLLFFFGDGVSGQWLLVSNAQPEILNLSEAPMHCSDDVYENAFFMVLEYMPSLALSELLSLYFLDRKGCQNRWCTSYRQLSVQWFVFSILAADGRTVRLGLQNFIYNNMNEASVLLSLIPLMSWLLIIFKTRYLALVLLTSPLYSSLIHLPTSQRSC